MAVNLISSEDISIQQTGSDIDLHLTGKTGDLVVDSIRTKNMFDGNFTQGHHTSATETNRICNVGLLPIKSVNGKSYVFSTNLPNTFKWKIMNCSTNQLNPTIYTDTNYVSSGDRNINCYNDGYLIIIIGKNDNSAIKPSDVSSYWFQVEEGSTSTTYTPFQNLNPYSNIYSTNETRIGTWINGKPLYRKVFEITPNIAVATTSATFDINLANVEEVFISPETKVADTSSSGWVYFFPNIHSNTNYIIGGYIAIQSSKLVFNVRKGNAVGFYAIKLTLEYTKTTD